MASDGADSRYVLIKASEGKGVVVTKAVAMQSPALKKIIESELSTTQVIIEMTYFSEAVFNKIFEYCEKHLYDGDCNPAEYKNEIMDFDKKFVDMEAKQLYKIAEAARYLEMNELFDLAYKKAKTLLKGQSSTTSVEVTKKEEDSKPEKGKKEEEPKPAEGKKEEEPKPPEEKKEEEPKPAKGKKEEEPKPAKGKKEEDPKPSKGKKEEDPKPAKGKKEEDPNPEKRNRDRKGKNKIR